MAEEVSKCGPICQHPGCWHTSPHSSHAQQKGTDYMRFLSELLLRKKELKRLQVRDALHSETHTSDGLPTLKVQSINQKLVDSGYRITGERRRSKTLPPLKICTRKCSKDRVTKHQEIPSKSAVNYVQMQLQVDKEELDSNLCSEIFFSPVLLWRPGRKHPPLPLTPSENLEAENKHQGDKMSLVNTKQSDYYSQPHPQQPHPLPQAPQHIPGAERDKEKRDIDVRMRRMLTENMVGRKGQFVPVKTTNLTDALPPQESFESTVNEKKDAPVDTKHGRARPRVTTADTERFSYLGNISPQVVAEILHQLRSESSSSIDGTTFRHPSITTTTKNNFARQKSQKAYPSTHQHAPLVSSPHAQQSNAHNTSLPASLAYELSTRRVIKLSPVRRNKRVTSFSRELSKRPLEVLRRRSNQSLSRQQLMEKVVVPKTVRSRQSEDRTGQDLPLPTKETKKRPYQMHLPTAAIEPPTDLPPGIRPRYQPYAENDVWDSPTHYDARPSRSRAARHSDETGFNQEHSDVPQPRVPSTIVMQLQQGDSPDHYEAVVLEPRRSGYSNVLSPKHQPTVVPRNTVVHPFSEEGSPNLEIEARALLKTRESLSAHEKKKSREPSARQESLSVEQEHADLQPSVSPDFMLVGAHFADNNLVLIDKDGRIIHQLTDTEAESDANIIAHLTELNGDSTVNVEIEQHQMHSRVESSDVATSVVQCASKPGTGMRAPPSTAVEASRSTGGESEREPSTASDKNGQNGTNVQDESVKVATSTGESEVLVENTMITNYESQIGHDDTGGATHVQSTELLRLPTVIHEEDEAIDSREAQSCSSVQQQELTLASIESTSSNDKQTICRSDGESGELVISSTSVSDQDKGVSVECNDGDETARDCEDNEQAESNVLLSQELETPVLSTELHEEAVETKTYNGLQHDLVASPTEADDHEECVVNDAVTECDSNGQIVSDGELSVQEGATRRSSTDYQKDKSHCESGQTRTTSVCREDLEEKVDSVIDVCREETNDSENEQAGSVQLHGEPAPLLSRHKDEHTRPVSTDVTVDVTTQEVPSNDEHKEQSGGRECDEESKEVDQDLGVPPSLTVNQASLNK